MMPETKCPLLGLKPSRRDSRDLVPQPCMGNECQWWVIPAPWKDSRDPGCALTLLAKGEKK